MESNKREMSIEELEKQCKAASETAGFLMATHAAFNYGRVLEHNGSYAEAVAVYEDLNSKHPSDDWAKLAKSRILSLKAEGKAE